MTSATTPFFGESSASFESFDSSQVELGALSQVEQERILKTNSVAESAIRQETASPESLTGSVSMEVPDEKLCERVGSLYTILILGLESTNRAQDEVHGYAQEATELQDVMASLIALKSKLSIHNVDQEFLVLGDDVRHLSKTLEDADIGSLLGTDEQKVSRERTVEIKAAIDSHLERIKTNLQTLFTTKIQVRVSEMNALLECLKTLEKYIDKLMSTIVQNQAKR